MCVCENMNKESTASWYKFYYIVNLARISREFPLQIIHDAILNESIAQRERVLDLCDYYNVKIKSGEWSYYPFSL